jgi:uncharacterized membrane protein
MGAAQWGAIGLLSAAIIVGCLGAAIVYQIGRSSTVATFDFDWVVFAAIWGFFLFDEVPNRHAMAGIVLIVGAGILAIRVGAVSPVEVQGADVDGRSVSGAGRK